MDDAGAAESDGTFALMDAALVRLRRLWAGAGRLGLPDGRSVELSGLLVVEACARAVGEGEELTLGGFARFAGVTASTATRLADRAVEAGLVVRRGSAADARRQRLVLTAEGDTVRARALTIRKRWLAEVFADWPDEDADRLAGLLARFADDVARLGGPGGAPPGR